MSIRLPRSALISILLASAALFAATAQAQKGAKMPVVIEIAKFKLAPGTTAADFKPLDRAVELQHVRKQPGFISREAAAGDNGEWLVIVHWKSVKDAEASMKSFATAPAAQAFMSKLDASTMTMQRYAKQ